MNIKYLCMKGQNVTDKRDWMMALKYKIDQGYICRILACVKYNSDPSSFSDVIKSLGVLVQHHC